ncbi:choice-of-anchor A family protein [uncultured Azohydromonas sp.]|jgi:PEP-CTERM putative exosortase interaction domain|uniref:choice-of-anchor A family protein n=1 Tax=uncultured Azohydromonas sp. TaxID=487342 RepID=UPI002618DD9F|nr:choice-of-anchor A family protein [uncultured Azohydromonas sp.]
MTSTFPSIASRLLTALDARLKAPACAVALAAGMLAVPASSQAAPVNLGMAGNFNVFALGDFTSSSDTQGTMAVQGNVTLSNYSVNLHNQSGYAGLSLVVGGNLSFSSGSIDHGNAYVGGTASLSSLGFGGTLQRGGEAPFSFADAAQQLQALSTSINGASANGKADFNPWRGVTFSGDGTSGTQVFDVSGSQLLGLTHILFSDLQPGQTLIFNVSGATAGFQSVGLQDFAAYNVLFNFVDATEITLNNVGVFGSILAPLASINGGNGQINGNVVVKDWNSNIQINNNHLFATADVALPPSAPSPAPAPGGPGNGSTFEPIGAPSQAVPEPGTLALLLPALGLLAFSSRRRRTARTAVHA